MFDKTNITLKFDYALPEIDDIKRCLFTLYATCAGSMPCDREFGLDYSFLDKPMPIAKAEFILEIVEKTAKYEPRTEVTEVTFKTDAINGVLYPTIHLSRGGEENE